VHCHAISYWAWLMTRWITLQYCCLKAHKVTNRESHRRSIIRITWFFTSILYKGPHLSFNTTTSSSKLLLLLLLLLSVQISVTTESKCRNVPVTQKALPRWIATERRWRRNAVERGSWVTVASRWPISMTKWNACSPQVPDVLWWWWWWLLLL